MLISGFIAWCLQQYTSGNVCRNNVCEWIKCKQKTMILSDHCYARKTDEGKSVIKHSSRKHFSDVDEESIDSDDGSLHILENNYSEVIPSDKLDVAENVVAIQECDSINGMEIIPLYDNVAAENITYTNHDWVTSNHPNQLQTENASLEKRKDQTLEGRSENLTNRRPRKDSHVSGNNEGKKNLQKKPQSQASQSPHPSAKPDKSDIPTINKYKNCVSGNVEHQKNSASLTCNTSAYVSDTIRNADGWTKQKRNNPSQEQWKANSRRYNAKTNPSKCLLICDDMLEKFDSSRFSGKFETEMVKCASLHTFLTKSSIINKIKHDKPEMVFMHVGLNDIRDLRSCDDILNDFKQVVWKLLENTEVKLCYSNIIPILGYPDLNKRITEVNNIFNNFLSQARDQIKYRKRIFTSGNDNLGGFIKRMVGKDGILLKLDQRGENKIWIRMRDALFRMASSQEMKESSHITPSNG